MVWGIVCSVCGMGIVCGVVCVGVYCVGVYCMCAMEVHSVGGVQLSHVRKAYKVCSLFLRSFTSCIIVRGVAI